MATPLKTQAPLPQDYSDILQVLPRLPPPDMAAGQAALAGLADIAPEQRAMRGWLARWQGKAAPRLNHPRLSIFAANHGCGLLDADATITAASLADIAAPDGAVSRLAAAVDADVRLYEMNLAAATRDCRTAPAMGQPECLQAMTYGMMAVEPGLDVLALAAYGDGAALAGALLLAATLGQDIADFLNLLALPSDWAAPCQPVVERLQTMEPCDRLAAAGGPDIAALFGALLAGGMARTPIVIADGAGLAALALLHQLDPLAGRHVALVGRVAAITAWPELLRLPLQDDSNGATVGLRAIARLQSVV